jgi:hypothetical protein
MFSHNKSAGSLELFSDELIYTKELRNIAIYTDFNTGDIVQNKSKHLYNIAWLIESPEYSRYESLEYFDLILTHDSNVLNNYSNSILFPIGGCWINPLENVQVKSKLISIIASEKRYTFGQKLRHSIIENHKDLDVYGRGYFPIENKSTALFDYKYSIIIENCESDYYFSEKLIDCFISKTIPIYFGARYLPKQFLESGIIRFHNSSELETVLNNLDNINISECYVLKNRLVAEEYMIPENRLVKIINKMCGEFL